jgi:WD40 repeat protein
VWDVQTGQCQHTLEGHLGEVNSVVFSPDGSRVASGSYDNTVRVWDVQTGQCQHTLRLGQERGVLARRVASGLGLIRQDGAGVGNYQRGRAPLLRQWTTPPGYPIQ